MNKQQLQILTDLCEMGVNPEALAKVVQQLKSRKQQQIITNNNSHSHNIHNNINNNITSRNKQNDLNTNRIQRK